MLLWGVSIAMAASLVACGGRSEESAVSVAEAAGKVIEESAVEEPVTEEIVTEESAAEEQSNEVNEESSIKDTQNKKIFTQCVSLLCSGRPVRLLARHCRVLLLTDHPLVTASFSAAATPTAPWISEGMISLVALPSAALSNASRLRRRIMASPGAASLISWMPLALAS